MQIKTRQLNDISVALLEKPSLAPFSGPGVPMISELGGDGGASGAGVPAVGLVHSAPGGGLLRVVTGNPWQLPPVGGKLVGRQMVPPGERRGLSLQQFPVLPPPPTLAGQGELQPTNQGPHGIWFG